MGFISGLAQAFVDTVSLPVDVAKDVVGAGENNTAKKIEKIGEEIDEALF